MNNDTKISVRQFTILVMLSTIGTTIFAIQASLTADAKQDAWIAAIVGVSLGLLFISFFNYFSTRFPNMTLIECIQKVFGKWVGTLFSLYFIFFSLISASDVLFYVGNFISTQILVNTPIEIINILFACTILFGMRLGLATLARTAEILFSVFIVLFFVFCIFLFPQSDYDHFKPIFENGLKPILKGSITYVGTAVLPLFGLLMIYPAQVTNPMEAQKGFIIGSFLGGVVSCLVIFLSIAILGVPLSEMSSFPSYLLTKKIDVGNFIQRVEAIMAIMWLLTIFFKMTMYFYGFVVGIAQVCSITNYRPLLLPCGLIWVTYSIIVYPNTVYMGIFDSEIFLPFAITIGIILPLLLLSVDTIQRKIKGSHS